MHWKSDQNHLPQEEYVIWCELDDLIKTAENNALTQQERIMSRHARTYIHNNA